VDTRLSSPLQPFKQNDNVIRINGRQNLLVDATQPDADGWSFGVRSQLIARISVAINVNYSRSGSRQSHRWRHDLAATPVTLRDLSIPTLGTLALMAFVGSRGIKRDQLSKHFFIVKRDK
jgi:hypothetical protein